MTTYRNQTLGLATLGLLSGLMMATTQGCDDGGGPLGNLAEQCGLVCSAEGIIEGNASISGVASVDAFFGAVVNVRNAALNVSATVRAELEGMAASLGIAGYAEMDMPTLSAEVRGAIEAKLAASVSGGLTIQYEPPKCEASLEVTAKAAAECDVEADPGMISASCMGSCEVSADVAADCSAMGTLRCSGQAPMFQCDGSCSGSCQLSAAAACSGSCNGTCEGSCSACAGGNCNTDAMTGFVTNCAGSCDANCQGECKLEAGGECMGRCEGSCEYTPPMGAMCEANATAKCDVSAMAEAQCQGKCEGEVTPPMVKAECQATVEAKAKAEVECTPPSLSVEFQWSASLEGDLDAQAEFRAWLEGFKARFGAILAARAKLDILVDATIGLAAAAEGAVSGAVEAGADAAASGDLKVAVGLGCALDELPNVGTALGEARAEAEGSVTAVVDVAAAVGAGG